ncbi:lytic transglycosylase [Polynucleobacter cosmopolitanus]|uniref:Lytic transglycosylase n=2 Tax=Polynucleobacter cosmopolitanus TaxID=351345 RepID=A0A229FV06_9BURK|nr:lytic transglycosylase [Polynucleobacter cosmopolitanus]
MQSFLTSLSLSRLCRLLTIVMVASVLSACATTGEDWSDSNSNKQTAKNGKYSKSGKAPRVNIDKDSVGALDAPYNDLWDRIRDGFELEDSNSPLVIKHVRYYSSRPDYVDRMMSRSSRYLFYIVEEVERRKMPMELALLPFIESAFNPEAFSRAKASGMWQFMPATGKDFKLTQNIFRDERRDVIQSTDAALDYLQRLYKMFGDWELALAAYNWGEGNVSKAIKRNQAKKLPTDYASLKMPDETRNYVPKLLAIKNIVTNPKSYGLTLPTLENHPYFVIVTTEKDIDVDLAAEFARMTVEEFKAMNPSFNKPVILGASEPQILLPFGRAESFQENLLQYTGRLSSWTAIRVANRETVDQLATRLDVDANQVRQINNIPKGMRIKAGSTVLIPRGGKVGDVAEHLANNAGKLMLEREAAAKAKPKTTANNASGSKAKKPASKQASNKQSTNKQTANNTNKPKPKPQADSKVAANEKKSN